MNLKRVAAFYDSTIIRDLAEKYLVIDTNVRLEFLRGAFTTSLYKEKNDFLMFNEFYSMPDHAEIYEKVIDNSIHIAHIYAHKGYPMLIWPIF